MNAQDFEARMLELIPGANPQAMRVLINYAQELDRDETHPAEDFFDETYIEYSLVKRYDGDEIARQLYDYNNTFTWNPFEIRGAAGLVKAGKPMDAVRQMALDGLCDPTLRQYYESKKELRAFRELSATDEMKPPSL